MMKSGASYVANGNMYGSSRVYSSPFFKTEPFRTSVNDLYYFMLRRCLNRYKNYEDANASLELAVLSHMQEQVNEANPLGVFKENDAYYFGDSKVIRRIDKYESS